MTSPTPGFQLDALRRSTDDKMLAGVAGGIARALNIDPVIVRIGFVVLTLIGFAGPLLYVAAWLLVPVEGARRSVLGDVFDLKSDSQLRTIGLIAAVVIAVLAIVGDSAWGPGGWFWWQLWIFAWIAIPVGAVYWLVAVRPRRNERPQYAPPPPYEPQPTDGAPAPFAADSGDAVAETSTGDTEMTEPVAAGEGTAVLDQPRPPSGPPVGPPPGTPAAFGPPRPPREKWSPALLLLTLSAIVTAMGALALWSVVDEPVDPALYPAVALAIVAGGLLVGTRVGHPGALIPVGLLILPVLAAASFLPNLDGGQVSLEPATARAVPASIAQGAGEVTVDLSEISDPQNLAGRTLEIRNGLGSTTVYLPEGLDVDVDTSLKLGGRIQLLDRLADGQSPQLEKSSDAPGAFEIEIHGTAGEIVVMER